MKCGLMEINSNKPTESLESLNKKLFTLKAFKNIC